MLKSSYFFASLAMSIWPHVWASGAKKPASPAGASISQHSCRFLTEELPTMCSEYQGLKADSEKTAMEACEKRSEQGAKWKNGPCPSEGRVGLCKLGALAKDQPSSTQIYYAPGFSTDAAKIMCENGSKGSFLAP